MTKRLKFCTAKNPCQLDPFISPTKELKVDEDLADILVDNILDGGNPLAG